MPEYVVEAKPAIIEQDSRIVMRVILVGLVVGLAVWTLTYLLNNFLFMAMMCKDPRAMACVNADVYAGNVAAVIMAVVGVVLLVRAAVYRPLLIVLASLVSLWGLAGWLTGVSVFEAIFWSVVLYAVAYSLYAWMARIRSVAVMLIVTVVLVVAVRIVPTMLG